MELRVEHSQIIGRLMEMNFQKPEILKREESIKIPIPENSPSQENLGNKKSPDLKKSPISGIKIPNLRDKNPQV